MESTTEDPRGAENSPQDYVPGLGAGGSMFLQEESNSGLVDLELAGDGWDGVYGWELGQMEMGWADFDMRWIYGLDQTAWGAENDWGLG